MNLTRRVSDTAHSRFNKLLGCARPVLLFAQRAGTWPLDDLAVSRLLA